MRLSHWFRSRKFQPRSLTRVALTRAHLLAPHTAPGSSSVSGRNILCNPPASYPKTRQMSLPAKKFGCQLISYRNIILEKAPQSYPNFASNLNFSFNRGSPSLIPSLIFTSSKSPSSPILLAFCYSIGIKNLIRRMQNVRLAMSFAMGTCGDSFVYRTEGELSKAKPQIWRENHAEYLSEPGIQLHSSENQTQSLNQR